VAHRQHQNNECRYRSHAAGDNDFSRSFAVHIKPHFIIRGVTPLWLIQAASGITFAGVPK
jgi:hypothetical protein